MPSESDLSKKFAVIIRQRGGWARKIAGGPASAGLPDIVACYRGHGLWIETKLPGKEKTLTGLQLATLMAIRSAGGVAVMLTTKVQLVDMLDTVDWLHTKYKTPDSMNRQLMSMSRTWGEPYE